ncbi:MAG: ComEC/Rec2 family competence protein [Rikenellaceae bacterium]
MKRPSERLRGVLKCYPMLFVSLCFVFGILVYGLFGEDGTIVYPLFGALVVVGLVCDLVFKRAIVLMWVGLAILAFLLADYHTVRVDDAVEYDVEKLYFGCVVSGEERVETSSRFNNLVRVELLGCRDSLAEVTGVKGSVLSYMDSALRVSVGDTIAMRGKLRRVEGSYGEYLLRQGIVGKIYGYSGEVLGRGVGSLGRSVEALREGAVSRIFSLQGFGGAGVGESVGDSLSKSRGENLVQAKALMTSMVVGDRQHFSRENKESYRKVGAAHILAISGLHIGIVVAILNFIFGAVRVFGTRGRMVYSILVILILWGYALFCGMPISVERAAIMFTLYQVGVVFNRRSMGLNMLGAAAVIILLIDPLSIYDIGFQLSFVAMIGIAVLYRPLRSLLSLKYIVTRGLWDAVCLSLAAQIFVMPLVVYHFGVLQWFGLPLSIILWVSVPVVILCTVLYLVTSVEVVGNLGVMVAEWQNSLLGELSEFSWISMGGLNMPWWILVIIYAVLLCFGVWFEKYRNRVSRKRAYFGSRMAV